MHLATLVLHLRLEACKTPGDKRRVLRAMIRKLRKHFNVSLVELATSGPPSEAQLAIASVGRDRREAREPLEHVAEAVSAHPLARLAEAPRIHDH